MESGTSSSLSSKEEKLLRRRVRERARRAAETAEEKELRLSKRRARDRARRAGLSSQQRQDRLQHMRERESTSDVVLRPMNKEPSGYST